MQQSKKQEKSVSFYSSIQEIFPSKFLAKTFQISFLVWFQLGPEQHTGCLQGQPKFHPTFCARRKLNLLIKSQYIHKIRFQDQNHRSQTPCQSYPAATSSFMPGTIAVLFSSIQTAFSLLHSIKGFLFRCKSTILQPSYAVSGLKDVQNNFDKNKKCSSPTICMLLIRRRTIFHNHQMTKIKLDCTIFLLFFSPIVKVMCIRIYIM